MAAPVEKREEDQDKANISKESNKRSDNRKRNILEFEDIPRNKL